MRQMGHSQARQSPHLDERVRIKEVLLGDLVPSAIPVHGLVGHRVELLAKGARDVGLPACGPRPVGVAHREVDHAAVAPEPPRVDVTDAGPLVVRQQPHLRRQGVEAVPREHAEDGKPELAPRGHRVGAAPRMDLRAEDAWPSGGGT